MKKLYVLGLTLTFYVLTFAVHALYAAPVAFSDRTSFITNAPGLSVMDFEESRAGALLHLQVSWTLQPTILSSSQARFSLAYACFPKTVMSPLSMPPVAPFPLMPQELALK